MNSINTTNAKSLMQLLTNTRTSDSGKTATGFANYLSGLLDDKQTNTAVHSSGPEATANNSSANEGVQRYSNRSDQEYLDFWKTATSGENIFIPEQYYAENENGEKQLTADGYDYLAKTRVENARTLAPSSVAEAKNLYQESFAHLDKCYSSSIDNYGFNVGIAMNSTSIFGYNYVASAYVTSNPKGMDGFDAYLQSNEMKQFNGLAEESAFYGGIANLAEKNPAFKDAYDKNPESALDVYYASIVDEMSSITQPKAACSRGGERVYATKPGDLAISPVK